MMVDRILLSKKESKLTDRLIQAIKEESVNYNEAEKALAQTALELFHEMKEKSIKD